MPDIYRIGRTKIPSTRLVNGHTLLDLRRFMREDFTPHANRKLFPPEIANILGDQSNIVNIAPNPIRNGQTNVYHAPFNIITAAAKDFKFVDAVTGNSVKREWPYGVIDRGKLLERVPEIEYVLDYYFVQEPENNDLIFRHDIIRMIEASGLNKNDIEIEIKQRFLDVVEKTYYETYRRGLDFFWLKTYTKLSLNKASETSLDSSEEEYSYSNIIETVTDYGLKALEVRHPKSTLQKLFESSIRPLSSRPKPNEKVIWQGYLEKNNFWHIFKFNPETLSGQIDDSLNPIKGVYINPWASLTIEFQNEWINRRRLITAAIIYAICYNTPFIEYKF